jgi:hypothetical protein
MGYSHEKSMANRTDRWMDIKSVKCANQLYKLCSNWRDHIPFNSFPVRDPRVVMSKGSGESR